MAPRDDRDIGIDTYGYDYDESQDELPPMDDEREYDDDDPRRYGWRG
jgi:hypothetical protein